MSVVLRARRNENEVKANKYMTSKDNVRNEIIKYLKTGNPLIAKLKEIPLDESLVELELMDSFGVVDIVTFLENKYLITIEDSEITKEKFGSINKMSALIVEKLQT